MNRAEFQIFVNKKYTPVAAKKIIAFYQENDFLPENENEILNFWFEGALSDVMSITCCETIAEIKELNSFGGLYHAGKHNILLFGDITNMFAGFDVEL